MVNFDVVCDLKINQPAFDLPQQALLKRFCMEHTHSSAYRRKPQITHTDLCRSSDTQTMSHIVKSCPLTNLRYTLQMKTLCRG